FAGGATTPPPVRVTVPPNPIVNEPSTTVVAGPFTPNTRISVIAVGTVPPITSVHRAAAAASPALVVPVQRTVRTAGTVRLPIRLTASGRRQLNARRTLTFRLRLDATAAGGKTVRRPFSVTFKLRPGVRL